MFVLGGGYGGLGGEGFRPNWNRDRSSRPRRPRPRRSSRSSGSSEGRTQNGKASGFPVKSAATAASLALAGDTVAQVWGRWKDPRNSSEEVTGLERVKEVLMGGHDWLRSLRMFSYGFLLYGPGSHAWYLLLERSMPKPTLVNISVKVLLNQIVLGPCVIAVVFAWNNLWQKKLAELPEKYRKDALPTLVFGFRFWIPVSILNFGVVPLQARVAFMSTCAIFWNFYLSLTVSK